MKKIWSKWVAMVIVSVLLAQTGAYAANQSWSVAPTGTNADGQYLANFGANWENGAAPMGNGDRWRFGNNSAGTSIYNDFAADTPFSFLFESNTTSYTFTGNRVGLRGITNNNGINSTQTFNLDILVTCVGLNNTYGFNINGNGNVAINGTVINSGGNWALYNTMTSGTLFINSIALSDDATGRTFSLGSSTQKEGLNTAYSGTNSVTVIGNIGNGGAGAGGFNNYSVGKTILTGTNSYTGATNYGLHSNTVWVYDGTDADKKISNSSGLNIMSGTLTLTGGGVQETLKGFSIGNANSAFGSGAVDIVRASGASTLNVTAASVGRNYYSVLNVHGDNLLGSTGSTAFGVGYSGNSGEAQMYYSGVVGSWVTIDGRDWAVWDNGKLRALTAAEYNDDTSFWANQSYLARYRATNAYLQGDLNLTNDTQVNSLKIETAGAAGELTIAAGKTLAVFGGGLIFNGADDYKISGGKLQAINTSGYEIVLWQSGAGTLEIASDLTSIRAFTKAGDGTLILSGSNAFGDPDNTGNPTNRHFMFFGGTVKLAGDYALYDSNLQLMINKGTLDLNGHDAAVRAVRGKSDYQFSITNSAGGRQVDFIVGQVSDVADSEYFGLTDTKLSGNMRLVIQGLSTNRYGIRAGNTHTGGVLIRGGLTKRVEYTTIQVDHPDGFGAVTAPVEFGDNGGFQITNSGNMANWKNPVIVSGSNAYIFSEGGAMTSAGKWTGTGDIEFRNTGYTAYTLKGDMSEFAGTIKVSGAPRANAGNQNAAARTVLDGAAALHSENATYMLYRTYDIDGLASNLNAALQFNNTGVAGNYSVYLGDLTSGNGKNSDARMNGGWGEGSKGIVSNGLANSTVTMNVGSANHAYSEFAERIADAGNYNNAGAVVDAATGAIVAVTKVGTGTWALSGSNSYTGETTVSGGVLLLNGSGQINSTASVSVSGAALVNNSSVILDRAVTLGADGILGGSGTVSGALTVSDASGGFTGGAVGDIGTLTISSALTLGNFTYQFDLVSESEHDLLNFSGGLTLSGGAYTVNVNPLASLADFNNLVILSGLNTGDLAKWSLDPAAQAAGYSLDISGNQLLLNYAVQIPEPSAWALLLGGAALMVALRRRK